MTTSWPPAREQTMDAMLAQSKCHTARIKICVFISRTANILEPPLSLLSIFCLKQICRTPPPTSRRNVVQHDQPRRFRYSVGGTDQRQLGPVGKCVRGSEFLSVCPACLTNGHFVLRRGVRMPVPPLSLPIVLEVLIPRSQRLVRQSWHCYCCLCSTK